MPPLEDVREQVREDVVRNKALALAQEKAAEVGTMLQDAEDFAVAAAASDLTVAASDLIARGAAFPVVGINTALENVAFELPIGGVSDVVEAGDTAVVVHVVERQDRHSRGAGGSQRQPTRRAPAGPSEPVLQRLHVKGSGAAVDQHRLCGPRPDTWRVADRLLHVDERHQG